MIKEQNDFQKFELHEKILAGVTHECLPKADTDSVTGNPLVTEGRDLMGLAQTGTGKTAALCAADFTAFHGKAAWPYPRPDYRSDARTGEQTHEAIKQLGHKTKLRGAAVYGVSIHNQINSRAAMWKLSPRAGRLLDHRTRHH